MNSYMFFTFAAILTLIMNLGFVATSDTTTMNRYAAESQREYSTNVEAVEESQSDTSQLSTDQFGTKTAGSEYTMSVNVWQLFTGQLIGGWTIPSGNVFESTVLKILNAINVIIIGYGAILVFMLMKNRKTD